CSVCPGRTALAATRGLTASLVANRHVPAERQVPSEQRKQEGADKQQRKRADGDARPHPCGRFRQPAARQPAEDEACRAAQERERAGPGLRTARSAGLPVHCYFSSSPDTYWISPAVFLRNSASRSTPYLSASTRIDHRQSDSSWPKIGRASWRER